MSPSLLPPPPPVLRLAQAAAQHVPSPVAQLLLSAAFFAALFLATQALLSRFFPRFPERKASERLHLLQRTVGPLHALLAGWGGLEVLLLAYRSPPPQPWPETPALRPLVRPPRAHEPAPERGRRADGRQSCGRST